MRNKIISLALLLMLAPIAYTFGTDYNILDFGAKKDTTFNSSVAINAAVKACFENGGGRVVIPTGDFKSGTIRLLDNVELHLERGATLFASTDYRDFPRQKRPEYRSQKDTGGWYSLLYAESASNIAVTGSGTIDGQGALHGARPDATGRGDKDGRPRNILFISCKNVLVKGIKMKNAAIWNQHYLNCEDVLVTGIDVFNHGNRNNDGIDIDGCRRFILTDSRFDSDDDAVCLKSTGPAPCEDIVISNCVISSACNAIKCGTESTGGFKNINISNCVVKPSRNPHVRKHGSGKDIGITAVSLEIVDGGTMDGVTVNNITVYGTDAPLFIRLANRARKHRDDAEKPKPGSMRNISISDFVAYGTGNFTSSITASKGQMVENVSIKNFRTLAIGDISEKDFKRLVKEKPTSYPQPTMWRNLPCSGLFARHVKGLSLDGISLEAGVNDIRIPVIMDDIQGLRINGLSVTGKVNRKKLIELYACPKPVLSPGVKKVVTSKKSAPLKEDEPFYP
ncbi:exo-poly-alpha-D-galacturonosidase (plasmid) [Fulvitalea axinellae]|uniref:Exo-poly-alpha-D-galacturonosidase n=1 Tax=Fulvitalea axinellae TaxID=1182444 RepID=A0AAU9DE20_9BACT|nr:exo-poly-alpha-D-galacturonosidase [Fulvitalea axinellae]